MDSLTNEPQQPETPAQQPPPKRPSSLQRTPSAPSNNSNGRLPFWILTSVVVGFLLPVCACTILTFTFFASAGTLANTGGGTMPTANTGTGDAVAVVRVEGTILSGRDSDFQTGTAVSGVIIADLEQAEADSDVKAIVLRVDSPGGGVVGSAEIWEVVRDLSKPVVVSMGTQAASGGYYVSAPADYIFARPNTLTGSIGVIFSLFNFSELTEEYGIEVINITSGPLKDIGSPYNEFTAEEREIFQSLVDEAYADFVDVVATGRGLSEETVRNEIADGRIFTGNQALRNGLVDELGNLDDAVAKAASLGGISGEPRIIEYERLPDFTDFLLNFSTNLTKTDAERTLELVNDLSTPKLEYRYVAP